MARVAADARTVMSRARTASTARPSGVMPAFRGAVSLPAVARPAALAVSQPDDDAAWSAALAAAKRRAQLEEEERAWELAMARAKAVLAQQEEREWAALRARAVRKAPRLHSWP